jgi:hypothetical protein
MPRDELIELVAEVIEPGNCSSDSARTCGPWQRERVGPT